jgi:8-oxo-dGTP diphosphatase
MAKPKQGKAKSGETMHYSAGIIIKKDNKYLLIDRAIFPPGFASPAGHVDENETPEESAKREVKEETGLEAKKLKLLIHEEVPGNICHHGIRVHEWFVYEAEFEGELKISKGEAKSWGWYSPEEMKSIQMEEIWDYWFKKLGVLK